MLIELKCKLDLDQTWEVPKGTSNPNWLFQNAKFNHGRSQTTVISTTEKAWFNDNYTILKWSRYFWRRKIKEKLGEWYNEVHFIFTRDN